MCVVDFVFGFGQVKFESPSSMEVTVSLPHAGEITGMGIKKGVTVIVGGGFHGKSDLDLAWLAARFTKIRLCTNRHMLRKGHTFNLHWLCIQHHKTMQARMSRMRLVCLPTHCHEQLPDLPGTLLQALQLGIYNKVPGDGREYVVCDPHAVKIRAEDGRSVKCTDISPFINNLPFG